MRRRRLLTERHLAEGTQSDPISRMATFDWPMRHAARHDRYLRTPDGWRC